MFNQANAIYRKCFSQLKGDQEQCLVDLTGNPAIPQRKRTGKAGHPPGCRSHAAHLVPDVALVAHAAGGVHAVPSAEVLAAQEVSLAQGLAGVITAPSVEVLVQDSTGVYPMRFWRC